MKTLTTQKSIVCSELKYVWVTILKALFVSNNKGKRSPRWLSGDLTVNRNSLYRLPYNSYDASSENLVLDQLTLIPTWYFPLFSSFVRSIQYWYNIDQYWCRNEKFCLGHLLELTIRYHILEILDTPCFVSSFIIGTFYFPFSVYKYFSFLFFIHSLHFF